jgi:alpha-glucosidase
VELCGLMAPRLLPVAVALALAGCVPRPATVSAPSGNEWTATSPGGLISVQVRIADLAGTAYYPAGPRLYYRVMAGAGDARVEALTWSPLGISRADQDFNEGLSFVSEKSRAVDEDYTLPRGKRHQYRNRGTAEVLTFRNAAGALVELELRLFDDGLGFRYRFPEGTSGRFTVTGEATGFRLPVGSHAYLTPHNAPGAHAPNYQNPWLQNIPVGTPSPSETGWSFPALFGTPDRRHLLITEANLDGSYCGTHLADKSLEGVYRVAFPDAAEAKGKGEVNPSSTLPWATPWRVLIVADKLGTIVESSLVTDLANPSTIADQSWIKAGRSSWSWWSDENSTKSYGRVAAFIDLSASLGWEYSLVDEGWPSLGEPTWRGLAKYATARNVGLLLWYDSGVRHPAEAAAGPLYPLYRPQSRQAELEKLAGAGVRGVKVDFLESDKQDVIRLYLDILKDAAARKLVVDFHGSTLPRGWERTYPNLLTMESVRGAEMYKFDAAFAEYSPAHNVMQVFTRNVVGPMDYTPVILTQTKFHRRTTWAHEMALSVLFESGVQHFADSVETYQGLPEEARSFLRTVPAAWDEIHFFEGEPGRLAVVGRRRGRDWYIAGINGEPTTKRVTLPLDLLGNGTFDMLILADGKTESSFLITKRQRNGLDTQSVELRPYGGFAMRFLPLQ